jgi:hypothetical protein
LESVKDWLNELLSRLGLPLCEGGTEIKDDSSGWRV